MNNCRVYKKLKMPSNDIKKILPVVLVGGSGERLWPISRLFYPKPFVDFDKKGSMFQKTISRIQEMGKAIIVGNKIHRTLLERQLTEVNYQSVDIILEPFSKNTAPSLTVACMRILKEYGDPIVLVLPADHSIKDMKKFYDDIDRGHRFAKNGSIVIFGVEPKSPETQFGYIKTERTVNLSQNVVKVESFIEKPNLESAKSFLKSGNFYWNSGILMLRASVWIHLISLFRPQIEYFCKKALEIGNFQDGYLYPEEYNFEKITPESIDYAVLESVVSNQSKQKMLPACYVTSFSSEWLDLGSWDSRYNYGDKNKEGNVVEGDVMTIDSTDSIFISKNKLLVSLGLKNIAVIDSKDAIMVSSFDKIDELKNIVSLLKFNQRKEAYIPIYVEENWGSYEIISYSDKVICQKFLLNSGFSIPLDLLNLVRKKCIVINGRVEIQIDENSCEIVPFDVFEIPSDLSCKITNNSDEIFEGIIISTIN